MENFTIAAIQLNSSDDLSANILRAEQLIGTAAAGGAGFVACPENTFLMSPDKDKKLAAADVQAGVLRMQKLAANLGIWLQFCVAVTGGQGKLYNRSLLVNPQGEVAAYYDKIHLFDVDVPGGERHRESDIYMPGEKAVVADIDGMRLGMAICYDLRFGHLFRHLALSGASIISVPSAFTYKSGEAHWHILLRARAIENSCYIIAPAQCGEHPGGRRTYGHSLIIDPWGRILAEASEDKEEVIMAEVDLQYVQEIRAGLPSLQHGRDFK